METDRKWLEPARVVPLTGDEPFKGMNARVRDFWTWASSDLRENVMRGVLAEFLVALRRPRVTADSTSSPIAILSG
jgi:hypothetical protein